MSISGIIKKKGGYVRDNILLQMELIGDQLISKHNMHKLAFNIKTNKVTDGRDTVSSIYGDLIFFKKSCSTCDLKIDCTASAKQIRKEKKLPALTLYREHLHCVLKGNKDLSITKFWNDYNDEDDMSDIYLNHKALPTVPFDFQKFTTMEQLRNRINTLVLFH